MKKKVVVFTGAGISKESGIPTFRDSVDGLWEQHKIKDVASIEGWLTNPGVVLRFYEARMANIAACNPNAAHLAFAKLEEKYDVYHITQNIDNLLERAGCSNVIHLHGDIGHRKCENHKSLSQGNFESFETMGFGTRYVCDYQVPQTEAVKLGDRCEKCGGQMRPWIVWFGEPVRNMALIEPLIEGTEIFIAVGTSAQVQPAASLLFEFRQSPQRYFIDMVDQPRLQSYTRIIGPAGTEVPKLVDKLMQ